MKSEIRLVRELPLSEVWDWIRRGVLGVLFLRVDGAQGGAAYAQERKGGRWDPYPFITTFSLASGLWQARVLVETGVWCMPVILASGRQREADL